MGSLAGAGARLRCDPVEYVSLDIANESTDLAVTGSSATQAPAFKCGNAHAKKLGGTSDVQEFDRSRAHD